MGLLRRRPILCDAPKCGRVAAHLLSNGPDRASVCPRHIPLFERRWGQVFIRGIR